VALCKVGFDYLAAETLGAGPDLSREPVMGRRGVRLLPCRICASTRARSGNDMGFGVLGERASIATSTFRCLSAMTLLVRDGAREESTFEGEFAGLMPELTPLPLTLNGAGG
jgi:hypothetical protein